MGYFGKYFDLLDTVEPVKYLGSVTRVTGLTIESHGPQTEIGELCLIKVDDGREIMAEVVGFRKGVVILMPYGDMEGIYPGAEVMATGSPLRIPVSDALIGRIIDGTGKPLDGKEEVFSKIQMPIYADPPHVLRRKPIDVPLSTGIKGFDCLNTVGRGQRMGIFSGSGIGKSTLLGMIARGTEAEVNVIALIGERGREVRDFIEKDLGEEGLRKSIIVVSTSDTPPLMRIKGAFLATTIAEYFRDKGKDVVLLMDSVTRFARAQREVGLAVGEPPTTRGYTPSVYSTLPKLLERSGSGEVGSITGFYSVLVEADDLNEPISDTIRGILDGHIALARSLANKSHYPAIDILNSISRLMVDIVSPKFREISNKIRKIIATYREAEDLINIGAYAKGSNKEIDYAISMIDKINTFLQQGIYESYPIEESSKIMFSIFDEVFSLKDDLRNYITESEMIEEILSL